MLAEIQNLRRDVERLRTESQASIDRLREEIRNASSSSHRSSLPEQLAGLGPIGVGLAALLFALALRALGINPGPWIGGLG